MSSSSFRLRLLGGCHLILELLSLEGMLAGELSELLIEMSHLLLNPAETVVPVLDLLHALRDLSVFLAQLRVESARIPVIKQVDTDQRGQQHPGNRFQPRRVGTVHHHLPRQSLLS
jgi:hypothetical protein